MRKTFYEITNKAADKSSVDLLVYGSIPDWDEDGWKMKNRAEQFVKDFKALEKDYDRINIRINSPGGSLYHAFPIFNAIRNSEKDIHTYNDGLAASAGGLLLIAGKTVHSAKNGLLMIHNANSFGFGNAEDLRDVAKTLDTYDGVIAKLFAEKTGMSEEDVKSKYLDYKDHWMDADEAKEYGFINEIDAYESEDAPPSNIVNMAFGEVMNLYHKKEEEPKASFLDKVVHHVKAALAPAKPMDEPTPPVPSNQPPENNMDFKNELDILNKETPTAEELASVRAAIEAITGENEVFTAQEVKDQVTAQTADLQKNLNDVKAEKEGLDTKVTELNNLVEAYKATGVQLDQSKGGDPDPVPGEEVENFLTEADLEAKKLRESAGLPTAD